MIRDRRNAPPGRTGNQRLLKAALAGLLAAAAPACGREVWAPGQPVLTQGMITSSRTVAGLTADDFQAMCDARDGTVEQLAHCGGLASAAGFAYDTTTGVLSEHTCQGANTCAGWNCITDNPG